MFRKWLRYKKLWVNTHIQSCCLLLSFLPQFPNSLWFWMPFTWVSLLAPPLIALTCVGSLTLVWLCLWSVPVYPFENRTTLIHLCREPPCLSTCDRRSACQSLVGNCLPIFPTSSGKHFLDVHVIDCISQHVHFLSDGTKRGNWLQQKISLMRSSCQKYTLLSLKQW